MLKTLRKLKDHLKQHDEYLTPITFSASTISSYALIPASTLNVFAVLGHECGHYFTAKMLKVKTRAPIILGIGFVIAGNVKLYQATLPQAQIIAIAGPIAGISTTCLLSLLMLPLGMLTVGIWMFAILLNEILQTTFSKDGEIYARQPSQEGL